MCIHTNGDGKEDGVRLYLVLLGDRTKDKNWNTVGISWTSGKIPHSRRNGTCCCIARSLSGLHLSWSSKSITHRTICSNNLPLSVRKSSLHLFWSSPDGTWGCFFTFYYLSPEKRMRHRKKKNALEIYKNGWLLIRGIFLPV